MGFNLCDPTIQRTQWKCSCFWARYTVEIELQHSEMEGEILRKITCKAPKNQQSLKLREKNAVTLSDLTSRLNSWLNSNRTCWTNLCYESIWGYQLFPQVVHGTLFVGRIEGVICLASACFVVSLTCLETLRPIRNVESSQMPPILTMCKSSQILWFVNCRFQNNRQDLCLLLLSCLFIFSYCKYFEIYHQPGWWSGTVSWGNKGRRKPQWALKQMSQRI